MAKTGKMPAPKVPPGLKAKWEGSKADEKMDAKGMRAMAKGMKAKRK